MSNLYVGSWFRENFLLFKESTTKRRLFLEKKIRGCLETPTSHQNLLVPLLQLISHDLSMVEWIRQLVEATVLVALMNHNFREEAIFQTFPLV